MGLPLSNNRWKLPVISPHISSAYLRHFLPTLQGSLLSFAGGQEGCSPLGLGTRTVHLHSHVLLALLIFNLKSEFGQSLNPPRLLYVFGCFQGLNSHFRASWLEHILKHWPTTVMLIVLHKLLNYWQLSINCTIVPLSPSPGFGYHMQ